MTTINDNMAKRSVWGKGRGILRAHEVRRINRQIFAIQKYRPLGY